MVRFAAATLLWGSLAFGQDGGGFLLHLTIGGERVAWQAQAPAVRDGDLLLVPAGQIRATVRFPSGWLDLDLEDIDIWDRAHVVGVAIRSDDRGHTYSASVRHRDEGWEHYANIWQVRGDTVNNGVRELLHPHDDEQPFTRSQAGVAAGGRVTVEAADTVHGFGGSAVVLDLSALEMPFDLSYEIRRRRE